MAVRIKVGKLSYKAGIASLRLTRDNKRIFLGEGAPYDENKRPIKSCSKLVDKNVLEKLRSVRATGGTSNKVNSRGRAFSA